LTKDAVHDALSRIQFGPDVPALVIKQLPIGYGGQMTGRIIGLKLGLALRRKVIFLNDNDPPYAQSLVRPFSRNEDRRDLTSVPHLDLFEEDNKPIVSFDYLHAQKLLPKQFLNPENWIDQVFGSNFGLSDRRREYVDGWIFDWLKFVPALEKRLETDCLRLGVNLQTLGVHLRRGDKSVESAYVPADDFNEAIHHIYRDWKFEALFIASDDPAAPSALQAPDGVRIIFDTSEERYNNANHRMLMANPAMVVEETYVAFKNLRLLAACGGLVGQNNAHFATIAASFILQRDSRPERVILIDGRVAEKRSLPLRLIHHTKRQARAVAKRVLPRRMLRSLTFLVYRR